MPVPEYQVIDVYNKIDPVEDFPESVPSPPEGERRIYISAKEGTGILDLKRAVVEKHFHDYRRYTLNIPRRELKMESLKKWAILVNRTDYPDRVKLDILCSRKNMLKFKEK